MLLLAREGPREVRCVQAKCWRDTPLRVDEVQRLLGVDVDWRRQFPDLAGVLRVDLTAWGELDDEARTAAGDRVRVRECWRPKWMPPHLYKASRERRRTKSYRDELGEWYEGVVADAYYKEGYEVFKRSEVCDKKKDGGVDLVCVRW